MLCSNLLNFTTSPNDAGMNVQLVTELESSDDEVLECVDDLYEIPKNDDNGLI